MLSKAVQFEFIPRKVSEQVKKDMKRDESEMSSPKSQGGRNEETKKKKKKGGGGEELCGTGWMEEGGDGGVGGRVGRCVEKGWGVGGGRGEWRERLR